MYIRYQVCIRYVSSMYQVCICIVWFPRFVTHFPVLSLISLMSYIGYGIQWIYTVYIRYTYGIHRDTYGIHRDTYGIHTVYTGIHTVYIRYTQGYIRYTMGYIRYTMGYIRYTRVYRVHPQSIRRVSLAPPSERWKKKGNNPF
jgi:hypothetical protein